MHAIRQQETLKNGLNVVNKKATASTSAKRLPQTTGQSVEQRLLTRDRSSEFPAALWHAFLVVWVAS